MGSYNDSMAPQQEDDVTSVLSAVAKYGLPTALVCYLVYIGVNQMVGDIRLNRELMQAHIEASTRIEHSLSRSEERQDRIEGILRQSCVNQAKDRGQQQACWNAGWR